MEILTQGYELTQDSRLKIKLDEIEKGNITDFWGNFRKRSIYDESGNLIWYHLYDYDADGTQTAVTSYDALGNQTGHVECVYGSAGERLVSYQFHGDTGAVGRVVSDYENGNPVKQTHYSEEDVPLGYLVNEFDQNGNIIRSEQYNSDNKLIGYSVREYDTQGNWIKQSFFSPDGILEDYVT